VLVVSRFGFYIQLGDFKGRLASLTCVESQLEFLDLVGGARFSVHPFSVEAVHLNVVDELLHHQGHHPLVVRQTRNLHAELSGGKLRIKLSRDTRHRDA